MCTLMSVKEVGVRYQKQKEPCRSAKLGREQGRPWVLQAGLAPGSSVASRGGTLFTTKAFPACLPQLIRKAVQLSFCFAAFEFIREHGYLHHPTTSTMDGMQQELGIEGHFSFQLLQKDAPSFLW